MGTNIFEYIFIFKPPTQKTIFMESNKNENPTNEHPKEDKNDNEDKAVQEKLLESNWDETIQKFEELNLNKDL